MTPFLIEARDTERAATRKHLLAEARLYLKRAQVCDDSLLKPILLDMSETALKLAKKIGRFS
jgi:hypothetical protein